MAVPKKKTSKSKRNMRRAHDRLGQINVVEDSKTGEWKLPHHIGPDGTYRGKQVIQEAEEIVAETDEAAAQ